MSKNRNQPMDKNGPQDFGASNNSLPQGSDVSGRGIKQSLPPELVQPLFSKVNFCIRPSDFSGNLT